MQKISIASLFVAGFTFAGVMSAAAHCGTCGVEAKHDHEHAEKHDHEHSDGIKAYVKGETKCCSAEHFAKAQKEKIADDAKAEFKEGACCSAEHYASKKVEAAKTKALKSEYKKGETSCCSAEHYAKTKLKAGKSDKAE